MASYRQYRSFGHGRFVSATLSINIWVWLAGAVVIGVIIGGALL